MIAVVGECLIELSGERFGALRQTFGGDTLNTAVYLGRLTRGEIAVRYLSALGTDELSEGMVQRWRKEGIDTSCVLRDPARLPGLYLIEVDRNGERSLGARGCRYSDGDVTFRVTPPPIKSVVDTTAAGDAFNAAFIAGWLAKRDAQDCCRLDNALAGTVIQYPGAIIPAAATPTLPQLLKRLHSEELPP